MSVYQKTITVQKAHIDGLHHVNNVQYLQWAQDISKEHWHLKSTPDMKENFIWVVVNHNITYKKSVTLNETLTLKTYIAENKGVISVRVVEMYNSGQELVCEAQTKWCLLNASTGKPMKVPQEVNEIFNIA